YQYSNLEESQRIAGSGGSEWDRRGRTLASFADRGNSMFPLPHHRMAEKRRKHDWRMEEGSRRKVARSIFRGRYDRNAFDSSRRRRTRPASGLLPELQRHYLFAACWKRNAKLSGATRHNAG